MILLDQLAYTKVVAATLAKTLHITIKLTRRWIKLTQINSHHIN